MMGAEEKKSPDPDQTEKVQYPNEFEFATPLK
jgi:hypothetical protein